jgi:hypothetical protein
MVSVHDNMVYALAVDYEGRRVVLHTIYPYASPPEFTDIVFEGVVASHIEQQAFRGNGVAANILFDVVESAAALTVGRYAELFAETKNYAWPLAEYDGLDDLTARLTTSGAKCFEVHSSCGLYGFVFAASMAIHPRPSRAQVAPAEPDAAAGRPRE